MKLQLARLYPLALALFISCAHAPTAAGPAPRVLSAVGCWNVAIGEWHPPPGADSALYALPTQLKLTNKRDTGYFVAEQSPDRLPDVLAQYGGKLRAFWKPVSTDSIEIWFPVWWSTGVRGRMLMTDSTMSGEAQVYVDYPPDHHPTATLHAIRVKCR